MDNNKLGKFIVMRRLELKKNQMEFAQSVGIHQSTLSRIESGNEKKPTPETLEKLANGLKIPYSAISRFLPEMKEVGPLNIYPLIESLTKSKCMIFTLEDLQFLMGIQEQLKETLTPTLINELMRTRKKKAETSND